MQDTDPRSIALAFIDRINAGDIGGIVALLSDDHEFIDTSGASSIGRETLRQGWTGYFQLFPDYRIEVTRAQAEGNIVTLVGTSSGTLSEHGKQALRRPDGSLPPPEDLQGPAIWTALVRDGLIARWCVYLDTTEVRASLGVPM